MASKADVQPFTYDNDRITLSLMRVWFLAEDKLAYIRQRRAFSSRENSERELLCDGVRLRIFAQTWPSLASFRHKVHRNFCRLNLAHF